MKNKFKIKIVSVGDFGNSIIKNFSNFNLQNAYKKIKKDIDRAGKM